MSETVLGNIADIITGPFGSQLHRGDYVDTGIPVIMPQNIENRRVNENGIARITSADYQRLKKYAVKKNDLIFARRGDVEKHAFISDPIHALCGTGCLRVRVKAQDVNPLFLSLYLCRPETRRWLTVHAVGSNMPNLNTGILAAVPVVLPKYDMQVRIADLLQKFDDKLLLNSRINDSLQQMAYATYMHLFFGKAANGKLGDIVIENPKSTIRVGEAKGVAGDFPFFTSGDAVLRWPKALVHGRNCYLNTGGNAGVKFYVGQSAYSADTWCITAPNGLADYLYLSLESIKSELNKKFFQGTGLKHLQKPLLKDRRIYIPSNNEIAMFNEKVQPWLTMISDNTRESQQLAALRDWLLPMLMNGQAVIDG